jgi:hypothetical protein
MSLPTGPIHIVSGETGVVVFEAALDDAGASAPPVEAASA